MHNLTREQGTSESRFRTALGAPQGEVSDGVIGGAHEDPVRLKGQTCLELEASLYKPLDEPCSWYESAPKTKVCA
jgi:hypothetical protein